MEKNLLSSSLHFYNWIINIILVDTFIEERKKEKNVKFFSVRRSIIHASWKLKHVVYIVVSMLRCCFFSTKRIVKNSFNRDVTNTLNVDNLFPASRNETTQNFLRFHLTSYFLIIPTKYKLKKKREEKTHQMNKNQALITIIFIKKLVCHIIQGKL